MSIIMVEILLIISSAVLSMMTVCLNTIPHTYPDRIAINDTLNSANDRCLQHCKGGI